MKITQTRIICFLIVLSVILSGAVVFLYAAWQPKHSVIVDCNDIYIETIEQLNSIEGFKNIRLKMSKGSIGYSEKITTKVQFDMGSLIIEQDGKPLFEITSNVIESSDAPTFHTLGCSTNNGLSSFFTMDMKGNAVIFGLFQDKPTGLIQIDSAGEDRWKPFIYSSMKNKQEYHDIYTDIDFDGSFDVRLVVKGETKKAIRKYIMLDMEWVLMNGVAQTESPPKAMRKVNGKKIRYEFSDNEGWHVATQEDE